MSQRKATEARRRRSGGMKVDGAGRAEGFSSKVVGSFWSGTILDPPSKKRGSDRSWQMQKMQGSWEQTAGGNTRRCTVRCSNFCGAARTCGSGVR